jgi:CheY-like chemotaxis protein
MMPSGQDVTDAFRAESPLHFLVVDDNAINKSLFARTVDNMFKKLKREQSPVYTFASDGGQPLLSSVVQSLASFAVLDKVFVISGLEAVELFKRSLDDTIQGSTTKPQDFDCIFMVECASLFFRLNLLISF